MLNRYYVNVLMGCLLMLFIPTSQAEKKDADQPLQISASAQSYDGTKKITHYSGPVHLKKGTLTIDANRLQVVEQSDGTKIGTLWGDINQLVHFKQKRDGGSDLWTEGWAEKMTYNDTLERIQLFGRAKIMLLENSLPTHEASGAYIAYNSLTDFMSVHNTIQGVSVPNRGLTHAVIYPNKKTLPLPAQ